MRLIALPETGPSAGLFVSGGQDRQASSDEVGQTDRTRVKNLSSNKSIHSKCAILRLDNGDTGNGEKLHIPPKRAPSRASAARGAPGQERPQA